MVRALTRYEVHVAFASSVISWLPVKIQVMRRCVWIDSRIVSSRSVVKTPSPIFLLFAGTTMGVFLRRRLDTPKTLSSRRAEVTLLSGLGCNG